MFLSARHSTFNISTQSVYLFSSSGTGSVVAPSGFSKVTVESVGSGGAAAPDASGYGGGGGYGGRDATWLTGGTGGAGGGKGKRRPQPGGVFQDRRSPNRARRDTGD